MTRRKWAEEFLSPQTTQSGDKFENKWAKCCSVRHVNHTTRCKECCWDQRIQEVSHTFMEFAGRGSDALPAQTARTAEGRSLAQSCSQTHFPSIHPRPLLGDRNWSEGDLRVWSSCSHFLGALMKKYLPRCCYTQNDWRMFQQGKYQVYLSTLQTSIIQTLNCGHNVTTI